MLVKWTYPKILRERCGEPAVPVQRGWALPLKVTHRAGRIARMPELKVILGTSTLFCFITYSALPSVGLHRSYRADSETILVFLQCMFCFYAKICLILLAKFNKHEKSVISL